MGRGACIAPGDGNQWGISLHERIRLLPPRDKHALLLQHQPGKFTVQILTAGEAMLLYLSSAEGSAGYTQQ